MLSVDTWMRMTVVQFPVRCRAMAESVPADNEGNGNSRFTFQTSVRRWLLFSILTNVNNNPLFLWSMFQCTQSALNRECVCVCVCVCLGGSYHTSSTTNVSPTWVMHNIQYAPECLPHTGYHSGEMRSGIIRLGGWSGGHVGTSVVRLRRTSGLVPRRVSWDHYLPQVSTSV